MHPREPLSGAPHILSAATALPPHRVEQAELLELFRSLWAAGHHNSARVDQLHRAVRVSARHLALPVGEYASLDTFQKANDAWIRCAVDLGQLALERALRRAGLAPQELDQLVFVTVTGLSTPSLDARLANRMRLRPDLKRTPIFGLGCVAGAAGTARAADALRGAPGESCALLAVELCSLTLQRNDVSVPNAIASGLFGDGAAALVLGGEKHASTGPKLIASRSVLYPDTERAMGWDVVDGGFRVVLSAQVPELVRTHIRDDVDGFLAAHGLERQRVRHWICHPGGPKVLEAIETALELPAKALARSWASLERIGNLSSASVLFVLAETLDEAEAQRGDLGLMIAMGPGFSSELLLLQW
ncbi:MAG: type III polyketide synthase [Myxococcales bacterium]